MYERVKSGRRIKGSVPLWIGLGVCILLLAACIAPMVWGAWYQQRWWGFVEDLSSSTSYAYQHGGARADLDGQSVRVEEAVRIYGPYQLVADGGRGRLVKAPERQPDILLSYGDGATLAMWRVKLEGYHDTDREYGLLLRYVNPEGEAFTYDTDKIILENMETYLSPLYNPPWEV